MSKIAKVPVIMQMESLECGAAALDMVLAYYGKWVPLAQIRVDCGVSRDGSNARNILVAARNHGLDSKGYRYELDSLKTKVRFPCILYWGFNHFVVLCGFHKKGAVINDPARGRITVSMDELDKKFTGICLQFVPMADFQPDGKPRGLFSYLKERLHKVGSAIAFIVLCTLLVTIINTFTPVFSRVFMDYILPGSNPDWLMPFALGMGFLVVLQFIVMTINSFGLVKLRGKLTISSDSIFFWHVLRLPMNFFSQRMIGDIAGRQEANSQIATAVVEILAPVVLNFVMLVFYLGVMLSYSVPLSCVGLLVTIINLWITQIISSKRVNITRQMMREQSKVTSATVNGIEMIETLKASGAEDGYFEVWAGHQAAVNNAQTRNYELTARLGIIPQLLVQFANITILLLGVMLIMNHEFTIGMLMAFQGLMSSFVKPANALLTSGQKLQEMTTDLERVEDVLSYPPDVTDDNFETPPEAPPEPFSKGDLRAQKLKGELTVRGLSFGYSPLDPPLIEDFNLELKPGKSVALVGSSGCGKSTIAKVLAGLYEPWSGEILYDGRTRDEIPREILCASLAVVDQDIVLFEDTIANNISLWDTTMPEANITKAAQKSQIHDYIIQREGGYGQMILEGGKNFSGGQRQELELARAFAQKPSILILDEATSALDAVTENAVMQEIKKLNITCVIIAHRLSTIRSCDEILLLERGRVTERGTHTELYEKKGLYYHLVNTN